MFNVLKFIYLNIIINTYQIFGYNYIQKKILKKMNHVYNIMLSIKLDYNIYSVSEFINIEDNIFRYTLSNKNTILIDKDYKQLCVNILVIGNILKNNKNFTLKKDFINFMYAVYKHSYINGSDFYDSFIENKELLLKYNKIIFNYNKDIDLEYYFNLNNDIKFKNIPNKDRINYGIYWSNYHRKLTYR